ncbi:twitching motility protein PilT [Candidatus Desantisbacteria bacterium CG2_30_40_21]|uniref:Twitching motility protein PilT n=1 Tax=Candidatus Desantisbacteria bacterium CG2_30_40_21 TaxID=1817895 RepID=A0A1J5EL49_9BACT|nr:MAG: twitching motility protein PilT [Candidatus Desantisbacteria bacterium CG2_30_40_21]
MIDVSELLLLTKEKNASDLHLSAGIPPTLRIHGTLEKVSNELLSKEDMHTMLYDVLSDENRARFEENKELDFSIELSGVGRFRVNAFYQRRGEGASFRLIPEVIKSIADLGLPPIVEKLAHIERGLVLVTGPTGSGKSTTLASMIDIINVERYQHIITIEDPIEFVHQAKNCLVNQREIGFHTKSFTAALRSALREDPDVILVGEMRDLETISMALTAAETGHVVFATLHTNSAPQTIDRIVDVFPPHQQSQIRAQLSDSLQGVVSQTLIPVMDGRGRVCAAEVMVASSAIRNLIREGKTHQMPSIIQTSARDGMQSMDQTLRNLVMQRKISPDDALRFAIDKSGFERSHPAPAGMSTGAGAPSKYGQPQQRPVGEPPRGIGQRFY